MPPFAVSFAYVERLQRGQHTSVFARHSKEYGHLSHLCLSIVAAGGFRSLDLAFETPAQLEVWSVALTALLLRQRAASDDSDTRQLWRAFSAEDTTGSGVINYHQCKALLRRLNIYQHKKRLKALYHTVLAASAFQVAGEAKRPRDVAVVVDGEIADLASGLAGLDVIGDASDGPIPGIDPTESTPAAPIASDGLTFQLFLRLIDLLRDRPDVSAVYRALISAADMGGSGIAPSGSPPPMPISVFHSFLRHDQKEAAASLDAARRIALHYDPEHGGASISLPAFTAYLTSAGNAAFAPEAARVGFHDMSQPLSHYFIESSHNTYLEGDQLQGAASVSAYISVLQKGCRCVELDCWDGPAGEPVIYHGHTLTGRVPFADVCRALRDYGFVASPFPLILSLEMHCTPKQQERIAAILLDTFGSSLAAPLSEPAAGSTVAGSSSGSIRSRARSLSSVSGSSLSVGSLQSASAQSLAALGAASVGAAGATTPTSPGDLGLTVDDPHGMSSRSLFTSSGEASDVGRGGSSSRSLLSDGQQRSNTPGADEFNTAAGVDAGSQRQQQSFPLVSMDVDALPSPMALMRKVVVKAKIARKGQKPDDGGAASGAAHGPGSVAGSSQPSPRGADSATPVAGTPAGGTTPLLSSAALSSHEPHHAMVRMVLPPPSPAAGAPVDGAGPLVPASGTADAWVASHIGTEVGSDFAPTLDAASPAIPARPRSRANSATSIASGILKRVSRKLSIGGGSSAEPLPNAGTTWPVALEMPATPARAPVLSASAVGSLSIQASPAAPTVADLLAASPALPQPLAKPLLVPALRSMVMLAALPFESLEHCAASRERAWHMHSLKEPKAARLLTRPGGVGALLTHTTRQLVRVYPGPLRLNSSNFHGGPYWAAGVQMVALNHQTHDVPMRVSRAFFRLNGRCGFVLKPAYMRNIETIAALHPQPAAPAATPFAGSSFAAESAGGQGDSLAPLTTVFGSGGASLQAVVAAAPPVQLQPSVGVPAAPPETLTAIAVRRSSLLADRLALSELYGASPRVVSSPTASDGPDTGRAVTQAAVHDSDMQVHFSGAAAAAGVLSLSDPLHSGAAAGNGGHAAMASSKWLRDFAGQALFPPSPAGASANSAGGSGRAALPRAFSVGSLKRTLSGNWLAQLQHHAAAPAPLLLLPRPTPDAFTLVVTVMGAQHLPKRGGASESGSVPSPFCSVGIHGDAGDRVKFATHVVADNGFNPVWSVQFRFSLARPEVAVLYVAVHDQLDVARKAFLAYFAVPVAALRPGYRSCQLRSALGKKIPFCSLLCRFQRR